MNVLQAGSFSLRYCVIAASCFHDREEEILLRGSGSCLSLLRKGHLCYFNQWMSHLSTSGAVWMLRYSSCFKVNFLLLTRVFQCLFLSHISFKVPTQSKMFGKCLILNCNAFKDKNICICSSNILNSWCNLLFNLLTIHASQNYFSIWNK